MRIGEVFGKVTLSRCHPTFEGASLKLVVPLLLLDGDTELSVSDEMLCVWDELSCGHGCLTAVSEGPEAARAFKPSPKPVDAYVAAILDSIDIQETV